MSKHAMQNSPPKCLLSFIYGYQPVGSAIITAGSSFPQMLFLELLLLLHELPDADRDVLIKLIIPKVFRNFSTGQRRCRHRSRVPVRLGATAIIVHAEGTMAHRGSLRLLAWLHLFRILPSSKPRLRLSIRGSPGLHLVPEPLPHAVDTPAHATIIRLLGLWRHHHPGDDGAPAADLGEALGAFGGAGEGRAEDYFCLLFSTRFRSSGCCGVRGGGRGGGGTAAAAGVAYRGLAGRGVGRGDGLGFTAALRSWGCLGGLGCGGLGVVVVGALFLAGLLLDARGGLLGLDLGEELGRVEDSFVEGTDGVGLCTRGFDGSARRWVLGRKGSEGSCWAYTDDEGPQGSREGASGR